MAWLTGVLGTAVFFALATRFSEGRSGLGAGAIERSGSIVSV
jgi:hypothetical protein